MYIGLKQPREDGERYVTPARADAKETTITVSLSATQLWRFHTELYKFFEKHFDD